MKKILALLLAVLMLGSIFAASLAENETLPEGEATLAAEAGEEEAPEVTAEEEEEEPAPEPEPAEEEEEEPAPEPEPAEEEEEEPAPEPEPAEEEEEEPAPEPEPAEEEEEEPAPEPEPAEEEEEEPAPEPEPAQEEEEPAPEPEPAEEEEEEPAPEPEEETEEPEEKTDEAEAVQFAEGYILLKKDTTVYGAPEAVGETGTIAAGSYAYASVEEGVSDEWLRITFDTEEARKQDEPLMHGYVKAAQATILTEEETEKLAEQLAGEAGAREEQGRKIPAATFTLKEAETEGNIQPRPDQKVFPSVSVSPKVAVARAYNEKVKFTATAKNTNGTVTYQWYYRTTGNWIKIADATSRTLTVELTSSNITWEYHCVATVNGIDVITPTARAAIIYTTPAHQVVEIGSTVWFYASYSNIPGGFTYQWQYSADAGKTWKNCTGKTEYALSVKASAKNLSNMYRCVFKTDSYGNLVSSACYMVGAVITPSSLTVAYGEKAKMTVKAETLTGDVYYWWEYSPDGGANWYYANNNTKSLTVTTNGQVFKNLYRCWVSADNCGGIYTNTVQIKAKPSVQITPTKRHVTMGAKTTFSATPRNMPSGTVSYQWQVSKDGGKTWKNTSLTGNKTKTVSITVSETNVFYKFRCVVTVNGKKYTSKPAIITAAKAKASVSKIDIGKDVKYTASVWNIGSNKKYQWQVSKDGGKTWANTTQTGNKTKTLTSKTTASNVNYRYRCKVTGSNGTGYTNTVYVTPKPRYFALIIANSEYVYQNRLPGVAKDGSAVNKALTAFGWKTKVVRNLTASAMQSAIASYFKSTLATDVCLLYYSGHGDNDTTDGYAGSLIGINFSGYVDEDGYYHDNGDELYPATLRDTLLNNTRGKVTVLLDSCGSGSTVYDNGTPVRRDEKPENFTNAIMNAFSGYLDSGVEDNLGELNQDRFSVLAACAHGKTSSDVYYVKSGSKVIMKRGGTFTYSLLRAMGCSYPGGAYGGSMTGDANGDKKLTLRETFNSIKTNVKNMNSLLSQYCDVAGYDNEDNIVYWCYDDSGVLDYAWELDQIVQMGGAGATVLFKK